MHRPAERDETMKRKPTMRATLTLDWRETQLLVRNAEPVNGRLYDIATVFERRGSDGRYVLKVSLASSDPNRGDRVVWTDDAARTAPLWLRALILAHRPDLEPALSSRPS